MVKKKGPSAKPAAKPVADEDEDDRLDNLMWEPEQERLRTEFRQERQEVLKQYREEEIEAAFGKHKAKKQPKKKKRGEVSTKKKVVKLKKLTFLEQGPLRDRYGVLLPRRASELPTAAVLHFLATASGLPGSTAGHDAADANSKAATKARRDRARTFARAMGTYKKVRKAYDTEMEVVNEENEKTKKRFKFKPDSLPPLLTGPPRPSTPDRPATPPPPEHQLPAFYTMLSAATRTEAALEGDGAVSGLLSTLQTGGGGPAASDKWHPKAANLGTVLAEQKAALGALHSNSVGKRKVAKQKRDIAALKDLIKSIKGGTREAPVGPTGKAIPLPNNPNELFKAKDDAAGGAAASGPVAKAPTALKFSTPAVPPNVVASLTALNASYGAARFHPSFDARHVTLRASGMSRDEQMHPVHKRAFGTQTHAQLNASSWAPASEAHTYTAGGATQLFGEAGNTRLPSLSPVSRTVASGEAALRPQSRERAFMTSAFQRPSHKHAPHAPSSGHERSAVSRSLESSSASHHAHTSLSLSRSGFDRPEGDGGAYYRSESKDAMSSVPVEDLARLLLQRLAQESAEDGSSRGGDPVLTATKSLRGRLAELRAELALADGSEGRCGVSAAGGGSILQEVLTEAVESAVVSNRNQRYAGGISTMGSLGARFQAPSHSLAPRTRAAYLAVGLSPLVGLGPEDSARTTGNPRFVKLAQPSGALDLAAGIASALSPGASYGVGDTSSLRNRPVPAYYKIPSAATRGVNSLLTAERIAKSSVIGTIDALGLPPAAKRAALIKVNAPKKTGKKTVSRAGGDAYKRLLPQTFPGETFEVSGAAGSWGVDDSAGAGASITGMASLSAISTPNKLITPAAALLRHQEAAASLQRGAGPSVVPVLPSTMPPDLAPQLLREIEAFSGENGGLPQPPQMAVIDFSAAEQYHDTGRFDDALQLYLRCLQTWLNSEELRLSQVAGDANGAWNAPASITALLHGRLGSVCMSMNDAGLALKHLLVRTATPSMSLSKIWDHTFFAFHR
jgi:hypothetical protein